MNCSSIQCFILHKRSSQYVPTLRTDWIVQHGSYYTRPINEANLLREKWRVSIAREKEKFHLNDSWDLDSAIRCLSSFRTGLPVRLFGRWTTRSNKVFLPSSSRTGTSARTYIDSPVKKRLLPLGESLIDLAPFEVLGATERTRRERKSEVDNDTRLEIVLTTIDLARTGFRLSRWWIVRAVWILLRDYCPALN